jgi:putative ABC transport system substrate-binding protein
MPHGFGISRRTVLAATAAWTVVRLDCVQAQAPSAPTVVMLSAGSVLPELKDAWLRGLSELGLSEDRDFKVVYLSTEGDQRRLPALITALVALNPAVVVTNTTGLTAELKRATDTIPIVAVAVTDAIGMGLAKSYAHPGGNITGLVAPASTPGKVLELLLEMLPGINRVGLLFNPDSPGNVLGVRVAKEEMKGLPITLIDIAARTPADIEPAIQEAGRAMVGALFIMQDAVYTSQKQLIADLALAARLPTAAGFEIHPEAGSLMSYGASLRERYHRVAWYVVQILGGAKPGNLPIEQMSKLALVINLKTANALGLTIPPSVLARADEVIE